MEMKHAAAGFGMLAQEIPLSLVRLLARQGATGMVAGGMARELGIAPSSLSFHFTALERQGLIQSTWRGRQIVHALAFGAPRQLLGYLTQTFRAGRPEPLGDIAWFLPNEVDEETSMVAAFNVLFICTRNSARSIMAEAILDKVGRGKFKAYSAGSEPADAPMPEILDRLTILGHDVSRLRSKSWHEFTGPDAPRMDFVLTLCDPSHGEICPDLGALPVTAIWQFPDPAKFTGSASERLVLLNELYGMIRRRLEAFTNLPFASLDRIAIKARLNEMGDTTPASH